MAQRQEPRIQAYCAKETMKYGLYVSSTWLIDFRGYLAVEAWRMVDIEGDCHMHDVGQCVLASWVACNRDCCKINGFG